MDLGPNGEIDNDYFTPPGSPVIPDNGGMEIEDHSISDEEVNYDCNGAELTPDEDGEDGPPGLMWSDDEEEIKISESLYVCRTEQSQLFNHVIAFSM